MVDMPSSRSPMEPLWVLQGFHNFMFDVDFAPGIEILWRLRQEYWGRGYATKRRSHAWLMRKENLPFSMVRAFTALTNKTFATGDAEDRDGI